MVKLRNPQHQSVRDIVCANTGMTESDLLSDVREYNISGLDIAATEIRKAIKEKKTIYVIGDYDVDGIAAAGIMYLTLKALKADVLIRLPKRFSEGYGLRAEMIDEFQPGQFLITVDNGISSIDAIEKAKANNMTVIVTDHHLPPTDKFTGATVLPNADIIIDPNAIPKSADFAGYCGAGLVYKLSERLLGKQHWLIPKLKAFAAIATIADSVPLIDENRRIVKEGLSCLLTKNGTTTGLFALLYLLDTDKYVSAETIGYKIAPALNAPSRLRDEGSLDSFHLLVFNGPFAKAKEMAEKLLEDNQTRKDLSDFWTKTCMEYIQENGFEQDMPIVAYLPKIPEGIIGIVAGRIAEKYSCPCFILGNTKNEDYIKGSGRSDGIVHLKDLLDHNEQYLTKYGGHAAAAGLTLKKDCLDAFRKALQAELSGYERTKDPTTYYDLKIRPEDIEIIMKDIMKFGPYGVGNPEVKILLENLTLVPRGKDYFKYISNNEGVKLTSNNIDAISFTGAEEFERLNKPRHVTLIGTMSLHFFMNKFSNQMEYSYLEVSENLQKKSPLALALERRAKGRYTA